MRFTIKDIENKVKAGTVKGYVLPTVDNGKKQPVLPAKEPIGLAHIKQVLTKRGINFVTEHRFLKSRRFRFDIAVLEYRLAGEYEGIFSNISRHTTAKGYTGDATKYNMSAIDGWTVLRYTSLNYKYFEQDLIQFLTNYKK